MNEQDVWESDRIHLKKEMDADITKRRIRKVSFKHNGKLLVAETGKPNPYDGLPVRVIYEDGVRRCYLICGGTITIARFDAIVEEG